MDQLDYKRYKVAFVGESGVGKSSLIDILFERDFNPHKLSTRQCDLYGRFFFDRDNNKLWMEVWDTVGQDTMMAISPMFIRNSVVVMVVFNLCDPKTLATCEKWIETVRKKLDHPIIILIGNQYDRVDDRKVSKTDGQQTALNNAALYMETSALDGHNITELSHLLVRLCLQSDAPLQSHTDLASLDGASKKPGPQDLAVEPARLVTPSQAAACGC